jgi:hypothetical protein
MQREIVANLIYDYSVGISILQGVNNNLNIPIDASPLVNFRDSLFHFRKLYNHSEQTVEFASEFSSIQEHLIRGFKDNILLITSSLRKRYRFILSNHPLIAVKSAKEKVKIKKLLNSLTRIDLKLRTYFELHTQSALIQIVTELKTNISEIESILQSWSITLEYLRERHEEKDEH